jgi:hypothetical protein
MPRSLTKEDSEKKPALFDMIHPTNSVKAPASQLLPQ